MARSIVNDELPFFLIPVASGVRSRRHLVLIRRVEAHKDISRIYPVCSRR